MPSVLGCLQQARNNVRLEHANLCRCLLPSSDGLLVLWEASRVQRAPTPHARPCCPSLVVQLLTCAGIDVQCCCEPVNFVSLWDQMAGFDPRDARL
jgi:hypothetical protein